MEYDNILKCGVKIIHSKNLISDIGTLVGEFYNIGNICVIKDKNTEYIADKIVKTLRNVGYIVYETDNIELCVEECVRYILGVGEGDFDAIKKVATDMDIPYSIFLTSPSTEQVVLNYIESVGEIIPVNFPDAIMYDDDIILGARDKCVASGYGRVIAELVSIFDMEFRRKVFARNCENKGYERLTEDIHRFLGEKRDNDFNLNLLTVLLRIGDDRIIIDNHYEAVDEVAKVIASSENILFGEASFLASFMILSIYKFFLSFDCIDTMIPIDIVKNLKLLEKMRQINYNNYIERCAGMDVAEYMKRSFVLDEYRTELLSKIEGIDLDEFARFWRRLYDDAGFWMKSFASGAELLRYLSVASELSDGSLLKFIKRTGFFERLI